MSGPDKADYPKDPYLICKDSTVLSCGRMPKVVDVKCEHVGACIVVHGVNDVGTAYPAVEDGLMAGLAEHMPEGTSWTHPNGGFFVWVTLPEGLDSQAMLPRGVDEYLSGSSKLPRPIGPEVRQLLV